MFNLHGILGILTYLGYLTGKFQQFVIAKDRQITYKENELPFFVKYFMLSEITALLSCESKKEKVEKSST